MSVRARLLATSLLALAVGLAALVVTGNVLLRSNFGHSTFHSGTVKVEKRMSKGLYFSTFYTYAKAIDSQDNDNDGSGLAPIQNRGLEKARAGYDRTHRVIGVAMDEEGWDVVKPFAQHFGINYRLVVGDDSTAQLYGGVDALPTTFLIDREGKIASIHV